MGAFLGTLPFSGRRFVLLIRAGKDANWPGNPQNSARCVWIFDCRFSEHPWRVCLFTWKKLQIDTIRPFDSVR